MGIPVVPARGGAEVALKIYIRPFSSIELACAVRQPSPCVRALCETDVVFHMSHLKPHVTLHTWQSSHFTPHPSQSTTSHFSVHTALLPNPHFTLHTSHFTVHTSHFSLLIAFFTLHTSHFTLHAWNDPSRTRRTDEVPFIAGCSHFTRKNTRFRAPASSPKHIPCNIHAAIPMRSCNHSFKNRHRTTHTGTTTRCKTHRRNNSRMKRPQPQPAAQTRYLSSPAAATLHGKTQGFVLRLPPQNITHATLMQPFQCDLQPQLQEPHRTTHTGTTTRCKTHRRNNSRMKRPQPHPSHTRGTFHRRLQPLYTEKHKVSCSGFLPKT